MSAARLSAIRQVFFSHFGAEPAVVARAPGRVELMGSHTDYNHCRVLTLPVDLDTWIAARPRTDTQVHVFSQQIDGEGIFDIGDPAPVAGWAKYLQGVLKMLSRDGLGVGGFDGVVETTLPVGGGLSSSAAIECATASLAGALNDWTLEPVRMARLCQRAENDWVGVKCGILDQYSACVGGDGGALLLDCLDLSSRTAPIASGLQVVVCDTAVKREVGASEYGRRRAECEEAAHRLGVSSLREIGLETFRTRETELPPVIGRRARFILEEDARATALAEALRAGDRPSITQLMDDSFEGACDLFEIGAQPMTVMMRAMSEAPGFLGGRQSGAGFGGCLVAVVDAPSAGSFIEDTTRRYRAEMGVEPRVFPVSPGEPAGVVLTSRRTPSS